MYNLPSVKERRNLMYKIVPAEMEIPRNYQEFASFKLSMDQSCYFQYRLRGHHHHHRSAHPHHHHHSQRAYYILPASLALFLASYSDCQDSESFLESTFTSLKLNVFQISNLSTSLLYDKLVIFYYGFGSFSKTCGFKYKPMGVISI